ncbi:MAG TPA: hydrogen peroxide-inducible genes activator [Oceanospirillales bacterium]|nr:hydrogen peroxide-inducible genes activator [Oceanospirillales bacterium]
MNFPTVKQLRYFIALVEHNHFGKAAQSCFVSQSAFSVAIKELENILNGRLVDRTNKSVTVTNLGRETYSQAKFVMQELRNLVEMAQGNKQPLTGKLSLGIIPSIAPFILSTFMQKIEKQHPDLELILYEDITLNLYKKLMQGDIDVVLLALPFDLKNTTSVTLFKDDFYLAFMPNSKNIRKVKGKIEPIDDSVILLEDGHCMREHVLSACKLRSSNNVSKYSASSFLTLVEMVKSDSGITYLPQMSLQSALVKNSGLKLQKLDKQAYREIGLVWRTGSSRAKEFELLGQFIDGAQQDQ